MSKQKKEETSKICAWEVRSLFSGYSPTECETLEEAKTVAQWNYMHDHEIVNKFTGVAVERFIRDTGRGPRCPKCSEELKPCIQPDLDVYCKCGKKIQLEAVEVKVMVYKVKDAATKPQRDGRR